ncbi:MAG: hypothetical protein V3U09_04040, partial [Thermoplasmata archaeon]
NGLINGNGFTNGLALSNITRGARKRVGIRYVALAAAFVILVLGLYGIVPQAEKQVSPITIDGQFQDWSGVDLYTDQGQGPNPDTSITGYGYTLDNGFFSFLIEVQGAALGDTTGYDSFYLFFDQDNDPSTGYIVRDLGADYMIEVFGGAGEVASVPMYGYEDTQDRLNFTQWNQIAIGQAYVAGNRLEGQVASNGRFDLSGDFRLMFCADDGEGGVTYSSVNIGPTHGALLATQAEFGQNLIVGSGANDIMRLTFEAKGADVHIESVSFDVIGALAQPIGSFDIVEGSTATRTVAVDTTPSTNGELIEISIANIITDTPYTIRGSGAKAYFEDSPTDIVIDGWFGDWEFVQKETDNDAFPIANPDLDIQESAVSKDATDDTTYFYLEVENELLGGVSAPQVRHKRPPSSGGQPAPPPVMRLKRMAGEDVTYIYIDSNTSDDTDGPLIVDIDVRPDYMIRIEGVYGRVVGEEICHWDPGWNCTSLVEVGKDTSRIEVSASIPGSSSSEIGVVFASTDWRQRKDTTEPTTRTAHTRGQVGPEAMAPIWPSTWISVVLDNDEGNALPLEILEVYFNIDANYLYVRIRLKTDVEPVLTDYSWWIYLDTDGDGFNDWIVVEMSNIGEVHGLAWNSGQWGGSIADWQDSIGDGDDNSAARSGVMNIGMDYGVVDFAVLRTNIGSIDADATIAAADNDAEDENLVGKTENVPDESLNYIVDATDSGAIPEFEFALLPVLMLVVLQTVMIKRRKRHSGS